MKLAIRECWGKRDLERQLKSSLFERTILAPQKVSPLVGQLGPAVENVLKDAKTANGQANLPLVVPAPP